MEEKILKILPSYSVDTKDMEQAHRELCDLMSSVSKRDLCKTCNDYWLGHEEAKKDKKYCISCKDAC